MMISSTTKEATTIAQANQTALFLPKFSGNPKVNTAVVQQYLFYTLYLSSSSSLQKIMGVTKEIVTPGDGKTFPKTGDNLTMHYQYVCCYRVL